MMQMKPAHSSFDRYKYRPHKFETFDDWNLCTWCGLSQVQGPHWKTPPAGWEPIETAPKNATKILAVYPGGSEVVVHWAQDLSGEDQPPFEGWFKDDTDTNGNRTGYSAVPEPAGWKPLN
jgi:hypothetical protein